MVVIQNGIVPIAVKGVNRFDVRMGPDAVKNNLILLSVGRLVHEKAYDVLIQAIHIVVQEYPNLAVHIAGTGPLQNELQNLITRLELGEQVHLLGIRNDVSDLMMKADIFVMSSRSEGMPIALLEAMSAGLPIIATRVGGIAEVVNDNVEGILVSPESPDKLAKAILQLIQNPEMRLRMGKRACQKIEEKYTIEHMCTQYENLILNLRREIR
jgi:glycosyltransferase involved in cell wall biosynthesis